MRRVHFFLAIFLAVLPDFIGADSLYKTVFLVGPDPRPVHPDDGSGNPQPALPDDGSGGDVLLPSATFPVFPSDGGRNLEEKTLAFVTEFKVGGPVRRNAFSKRDDMKNLNLYLRHDNSTISMPRALEENVCRITTTILGMKYDDNQAETGYTWIPPDPNGAAGKSRLVAVVNSMLEVRQKDGTFVYRDGFQSFFSEFTEIGDSIRVFDPKVIYDEHEGRFVVVVLQLNTSPQLSRIWLAVSKDETPDTKDDWFKFFFDSIVSIGGNNAFADYPGVEVDEEALYITNNMFRFSDSANAGVRLWVLDKGVSGGIYDGVGSSPTVYDPYFEAGVPATTMPAQIHGTSGVDGSVGTFLPAVVTSSNGTVNLQIYTLFNPLSASPTYTLQTISLGVISKVSVMPNAPQLGSTVNISTLDARTLDAVWRSNMMWVVFTLNPRSGENQGQATAHWVRCKTNGGTITVEAQGDLGGEGIAPGTFTFFPSVAVNSKGIVAYGYAASSPTTYAGAYASVYQYDIAGATEFTIKSGLAPYNRVRGDRNRWGDYTGISVDPTDDSFWIFNQYADTVGSSGSDGDGRWATVWGRLSCTNVPTPPPAPIPTPPGPNPTPVPIPTPKPPKPCGLFGLSIFCPFTKCGILGRLLGLCKS